MHAFPLQEHDRASHSKVALLRRISIVTAYQSACCKCQDNLSSTRACIPLVDIHLSGRPTGSIMLKACTSGKSWLHENGSDVANSSHQVRYANSLEYAHARACHRCLMKMLPATAEHSALNVSFWNQPSLSGVSSHASRA